MSEFDVQAGDASLFVSLNGLELAEHGIAIMFQAAEILPEQCTISGPDTLGCISNTTCSFILTSRDRFGNARTDASDSFSLSSFNASQLSVVPLGNGLYKVRIFSISRQTFIKVHHHCLQQDETSCLRHLEQNICNTA